MSNDQTLGKAEKWCEEARVLLKARQYDKADRQAVLQRASKILAELRALEKRAQAGRFDLPADEIGAYVDRFAIMAAALNEAARTGEAGSVRTQAQELQALKQELAARLAGGGPWEKAPDLPDDEAGHACLDALHLAQQAVADLRLHAQAETIAAELDRIVATHIVTARAQAEAGDLSGAHRLLAGVAPDCERAEAVANGQAAYLELLAVLNGRLQACRSLPQAANAVAVELSQVEARRLAAAVQAAPARGDPGGALALLREALGFVDAAEKIARRCQAFDDARPKAVAKIARLNEHSQAPAIEPELGALRTKLAEADRLAESATRRYEDASALLLEIETDAVAVAALAERCGLFALQRASVQDQLDKVRRHAHAEAAEAEFGQAQAKVEAATTLADGPTRDHAGAGERLGEAEALIEAGLALAAQCQQAWDARVKALAQLSALGEHTKLDAVRPRYEALMNTLDEANRLAGNGERKYAEALPLLVRLTEETLAARKLADEALWAEKQAETKDDLLAGLQADSPERTRLGALWELACEQARDGHVDQALRLLEQARTIAREAQAARHPVTHTAVEQGQAALQATMDESSQLSAAKADAQTLLAGELRALETLGAAYAIPGDAAPEAWKLETDRIASNLTQALTAERPALQAAIAQARLDIAAQSAVVTGLGQARAAWQACLQTYDTLAGSLTAHAGGRNRSIHAKFLEVKRIAATSQSQAAARDFDTARLAMGPQHAVLSDLLKRADAAIHCEAVQTKRGNELLLLPVTLPEAQSRAERLKAQDCLDEGKRLSSEGDFVAAVSFFDKIPAHLDKVAQIRQCADKFAAFAEIWNPWIPEVEKEPEKYKFHIAEELAAVKAGVEAAQAAADGGDLVKAQMISGEIETLGNELYGHLLPSVKAYVDKALVFEPKVREVEVHAGRPGIQAFWAKLKADADFVLVCQAKRAYTAATDVMKKAEALIPGQLLIATRYVGHLEKREAVQKEIEAARALPGSDTATAEWAEAEQFMQLAAQHQQAAALQAAVAKFDEAEAALLQAKARVTAGRGLVEKTQGLKALKPADASDLAGRVAAAPGMKAHVRTQASDGAFDALLNGMDAPLDQARAALQGEPPDVGAATAALERVDAILADALGKIVRKPHWDAQLSALEQKVKTALPDLNKLPNKCLDEEIRQLEALLASAKDRAKAPAFDFPAGLALVEQGMVLAAKATEKHGVHISLAADRKRITDLASWLDAPSYQPAMARELLRVRKFSTDIDAALAAFNFPAARKLAAEGKALETPYKKLCQALTAIQTQRTRVKRRATNDLLGKPAAKAEEDRYRVLEAQLDQTIDVDHAFSAAQKVIAHMDYLIGYGGAVVARHNAFITARGIQATRLAPLPAQSNEAVAESLREAAQALSRADTLAAAREFVQAGLALEPLADLLTQIETDIPRYNSFASALKLAREGLEAAAARPNAKVIQPLLDGIRARFAQAEAAGASRQYEDGVTAAREIPALCTAAVKAADEHAEFEALGQGDTPSDKPALQAALRKVTDKLAVLRAEPASEQQPREVGQAFRQHAEAQRLLGAEPLDAAKVAEAIRAASTACSAAEIHRQQVAQVKQQIGAAQARVQAFIDGDHGAKAFVAARMAATLASLAEVRPLMVASGVDAASKAVQAALQRFAADSVLAERKLAYDTARGKLEPPGKPTLLSELEKHRQRHGAAADIERLRSKLEEAASAVAAVPPDFDAAMASLRVAESAVAAARLTVDLLADGSTAPSKDQLAAVLKQQPDGDRQLDAIVAKLDPTARSKLVQAAFEVRFGCKLNITVDQVVNPGGDAPEPDVLRFYKNIAKLPPKHALKNDNLLLIEDQRTVDGDADFSKGESSDFTPKTKKLTMREGKGVRSAGRMLGAEASLGPGVPDACKPANDEPVQMFDWNTLHEAGHTVEDKYMFMDRHAGEADFGGWTEYGGDLRRIAEKLVAEFDYDLGYTLELLGEVAEPPVPEPKAGVSAEDWERRRVLLKTWVGNAQKDKQPWETNSAAQLIKLKTGEIIHDAYGGHWYGYLASARSQGITGYQFRSPVEWFSELYAARYTGKLKPNHPAMAWLTALETE